MNFQLLNWRLACVPLMILYAAHSVFARQAQEQDPGNIAGHVYRKDTSAPLAGAYVRLIPEPEDSGRTEVTRTGLDGSYYFSHIGPGKYYILAERTGFIAASYVAERQDNEDSDDDDDDAIGGVVLKSGQNLQKIDIRLAPAGVISGTIMDDNNVPVKGLQVSALQPRFVAGGKMDLNYEDRVSVNTDDLGQYRLSGLEAGSYCILVEGDQEAGPQQSGFSSREVKYGEAFYPHASSIAESQRIHVAAGAEITDIDFVLTPQLKTHSITGTVSNFAPKPAREPWLVLARAGSLRPDGSNVANATANSDGSFRIAFIPDGDYILTAVQWQAAPSGSSQITASSSVPVRVRNDYVNLNVVLKYPGRTRGRIAWDDDKPVAPFKSLAVWLRSLDKSDFITNGLAGVISEDGSFEVPGVEPGSYLFTPTYRIKEPASGITSPIYLKHAECSGVDYTTRPFTIESEEVLNDCTLTLAADNGVINGQVLDGEKPVRNFAVVAIPAPRELRILDAYTREATTDGSRRFKIGPLIPGDYLLFAIPEDPEQGYFALDFVDRNIGSAERVTVRQNETKVIQLKPIRSPQ